MEKRRTRNIRWIIFVVVLLSMAGGGYAAYAYWFPPNEVAEEPTTQTAIVTVGDLSITADGAGVLRPSSESDLSFGSSGVLTGLLVEVGDKVQAGDALAWVDDTDAHKAVVDAELQVMQAKEALKSAKDPASIEQAVAQAELKVAQAEANLATAQGDLDDLLAWEPDETDVKIAKANLAIAQANYENALARANMRDEQIASARISLEQAVRDLEEAQAGYAGAMDAARDWEKNIEATRETAAKVLQKAQDSLVIAQANYDLAMIDTSAIDVQSAWVKVLNAQSTLEDLQTPPDEEDITAAQVKVQEMKVALQQASLDLADAQTLRTTSVQEAELNLEQARLKLESAQKTLEGTTLIAPMDGTVVSVNAEVGQTVNGTAIVLADLEAPLVQFWVEESDLNSVAVGNRVSVVFEAFPDLTYNGQIIRVDPALVQVDNTSAVQAWASIDLTAHPVTLLGDMNADVEIIAGEAKNALLVPVQALRELASGQYAVFVVQPDGELELRPVEVGLMDYVNAEVRSGLKRGEVVSIGTTSAKQSAAPSSNDRPPGGPPPGSGFMRFLGGG